LLHSFALVFSDSPIPSLLSIMSSSVKRIFGMGNPLLDISAVADQKTLDTWGVKLNNAILAEEKHVPLYAQLTKDFPVEYIAGGATQNSIRVAQWFLQTPNSTTYTGCIGSDAFGEELSKAASADGVQVLYQINKDTPTGTCAVLIMDRERSLIANLAAANKFSIDHLHTDALKEAVAASDIFYSSGFFLTVSPPSFMHVAAQAAEKGKLVALNLAAPFISEFFSEPLLAAIGVADIVFGNESEAEAFATQQGLEKKDAETVAKHIANLPRSNGASRPRMAVITQGPNPTYVAVAGEKDAKVFEVPPLSKESIVDANGAGDAFVGGFLAELAKGSELDACIKAANYCARTILQVSGTALPKTKPELQ